MKILLVDDSRAMAMVTTARLESFGHEVVHAIDGPAAIAHFQQTPFDLILMDIEMPGMNGFEATTRIRALEGNELWAWTPIIFVTATDTPTNLVTAIEAGGDDFISKMAPETVLQAKMKAMSRIAAMRARLAQANSRLQSQANRDGLTGLLNRRAMDMQVDQLWEAAVSGGKAFSLLMIDVDHFKKYNDTYGHLAGDACLQRIAQVLRKHLHRGADLAARYGGEEFAGILPDTDLAGAILLAEQIRSEVENLDIEHGASSCASRVTVSIGLVSLPGRKLGSPGELIEFADQALYRAKQTGRNRVNEARVQD